MPCSLASLRLLVNSLPDLPARAESQITQPSINMNRVKFMLSSRLPKLAIQFSISSTENLREFLSRPI